MVDEIGAQLRAMQPPMVNIQDRHDFSKLEPRFLLVLPKEQLLKIASELREKVNVLRQQNVHFDLNSMLDQVNSKFNDKYLRKADNWNQFKPFIDQFISLLNSLADELEGKKTALAAKNVSAKDNQVKAGDEAKDQMEDLTKQLKEHEYNSFEEGQLMVVSAEAGAVPEGPSPYTEIIQKLRLIQKGVQAKYPDVNIGLTGEPVLDDDQLQSTSRDSTVSGILAFVLVSILFFVSYGRLTRPTLTLIVLAMGVVISLGYTVVTVGHLNLISTAFVAMVVGLGVDFGIQIMGRYEEELAEGRPILEAIQITLENTGLAIITGGSTTAAAFFTMCFNDFIGLAEFGVIAGGGILICLLLSLTVLPALYVLCDRAKPAEKLMEQAKNSKWSTWSVLNGILRYPTLILGLATAATIVAALEAPKVTFDYNLLDLYNPKLESVQQAISMGNSPAGSLIYAVSIADNLDEARAKVAKFSALPSVQNTESIVEFFPLGTEEKLVIIRQIVNSLQGLNLKTDVKSQIDVNRSKQQMSELLTESQQGLKEAQKYLKLAKLVRDPRAQDAVDVFTRLIPPLQRGLNAMSTLSQDEIGKRLYRYQLENLDVMRSSLEWLSKMATDRGIEAQDIPPEIRQRYLSSHGKYLIEIYPKANIWDREPDVEFVKELRTVDANVTGTPVQNYEYIDLLRKSYVQAAWYAFAAIVVLIGLHFRHLGYTLLTILPLALSILWTLGLMLDFIFPSTRPTSSLFL